MPNNVVNSTLIKQITKNNKNFALNNLEKKNTQAKMIVRIALPPFLKTMKATISQPNTSINELEATFFGKGWADGEGGRVGRELVPCIDNPPNS